MAQLKILSKEEKPLLARTEIVAEAGFEKALPDRKEIRKDLAHALKVEEEQVVVAKIEPINGVRKAKIIARVYEKKEDIAKLEAGFVLKRFNKVKKGEEAK
jgi:small subunit ribosomal protein S24e